MSQQLVPFNDRVIIKPIEEDEQMYGTIVIPDLGKIGRAHVRTPVTRGSRMPSSA